MLNKNSERVTQLLCWRVKLITRFFSITLCLLYFVLNYHIYVQFMDSGVSTLGGSLFWWLWKEPFLTTLCDSDLSGRCSCQWFGSNVILSLLRLVTVWCAIWLSCRRGTCVPLVSNHELWSTGGTIELLQASTNRRCGFICRWIYYHRVYFGLIGFW